MLLTTTGEYCCNPKYIAEEILRRRLPYEIIWVVHEGATGPFPTEFRLVQRNSVEFFEALGQSKVVIQNGHAIQRSGGQKGPSQYWLQTWHGSLGLKRLEGAGGDLRHYRRMKKLQNKQTDLVITNSEFENRVFAEAYWPDVPKVMLGHARNDILFNRDPEFVRSLRKKVLDRLDVEDYGQRFLLFAPTHNDARKSDALSGVDFVGLQRTLAQRFGGNWEVLVRTHPIHRKQSAAWLSGLPQTCHNSSFYPDMQELLLIADAGLTDYSSWVFDYILTNRPAFLLSSNPADFRERRGMYHALAGIPFTHATTNSEVLRDIREFDQGEYDSKIAEFLDRCGSIDDGESARRIVDKVEELMSAVNPQV